MTHFGSRGATDSWARKSVRPPPRVEAARRPGAFSPVSATILVAPDNTTRRRQLLTTALVGTLLPKDVPEGQMVRSWLDSWSGVGHVVEAMHATGYNVRLFRSPFCWWAEFCRDRVNPVSLWMGQNQDATPWKAVQRAALETLRQDNAP